MKNLRKIVILCLVMCCNLVVQAQVENHCIRLSADGQVDCGSMPELDETSSYTIQFWLKPEAWESGSVILSRGDGFKIQTGAPQTVEIIAGEGSFSGKNSSLSAGKWTQLTFICTKNTTKILVNGRQIGSKSGSFTIPTDERPFVIGGGFEGYIDELRVWNADLKASDFNYFINNTINKFVPQLDNLVAYYKFDQEQCPNIVDYKALFKPGEYNHHGIISGNVTREIVADNTGLPYLKCGAYTENNKFYWGSTRDQYLLANDIIILGIDMYADGHLEYATPNNHATPVNADYLSSYQGRSGVVSLNGTGSKMTCTSSMLRNGQNFTFETWIYLEKWTEGAYLFRQETASQKNGLAIYLGDEATKQVIVRCNGKKFINENCMAVGKWVHLGISTKNGDEVSTKPFLMVFDGTEKTIAASPDGSSNGKPSGMESEAAYIGENLTAKLDNTTIWNMTYAVNQIANHMNWQPMPSLNSGGVNVEQMKSARAFYKYDQADNLGYSCYSQDEWKRIMESAYAGYRGYQFRISVRGHSNWINIIADENNCVKFATDLAKLSEGYAGVELDLEWMYGTQTNLRKLADEILARLPKGKTLHISVHVLAGAYYYPAWAIPTIDGFTVQQYGPQKDNFSITTFKNNYTAMKNHGYPDDKIYLSYATTTSRGNNGSAVTGYNRLDLTNYTPKKDGSYESAVQGSDSYWFCGPYQTYLRAKFCVENNLEGIFYWDVVNDIRPTADAKNYSLAKYCNYGLASNVDTLVTEVDVRHIVTAIEQVRSDASQELQIRYNSAEKSFSAAQISENEVAGMEIFTATGVKVGEAKSASVSAKSLPAGVYLVRVRLKNGQQKSLSVIKR